MKVAGAPASGDAAATAPAAPAPGVVEGRLGRDGLPGRYVVATVQLAPWIRLLT